MRRIFIMFRKWINEVIMRKEAFKQREYREAQDYKQIGITEVFYGMRESIENYSQFMSSFNMVGDMDKNEYIPQIIEECHELGKDLNESVQKLKSIINQTEECLKDVSIVRGR